ncbi:MAG TPA: Na/Pi symporter [Opitutaceae bacterium]|jgi:phosphate:Na+ symporter|nr:Na/Pi symporter [Opitutaceae bacterium]
MAEVIALFLAGLSLFFYGVGGIRGHLQGLSSRRFRRHLARWAGHPALAGLWGFGFGAITQSSTAVAFILTGLVEGRVMTVAAALPIVACANLGTVPLVFCASFNIHLAFLYLLGTAGLALAFEVGGSRAKPVVTALFCVGLLFFGLKMMKDAFAPLSSFPWFQDVAAVIQGSALAIFVAGALLRVLLQSSSGLAVIAIALAHGGVLKPEQAAMMMFGTGAGVGLSVFLLSSNLKGVGRRLALFQAAINGTAAIVLATLYYVETLTGTPLLLALAAKLAATDTLRLAWAFCFLQGTAAAAALIFSRPAARWLEKLAPATAEQDLAQPQFLNDQALEDPESALDLAEREQVRLLAHLPAQLDTVRPETAATAAVPAATLHRATIAVAGEVQAFLHELADRASDRGTSERVLALQSRQALILSLDETIFGFVGTVGELRPEAPAAAAFLENLGESLNTLLLTMLDALRSGDPTDRELLLGLTADRGELMERLRRNLSGGEQSLGHNQKAHLFYLTSLFERAVWLLRQLGLAHRSREG